MVFFIFTKKTSYFLIFDLDIYHFYLYLHPQQGLVAQLNSASDYGSEGYWFESSRGHE